MNFFRDTFLCFLRIFFSARGLPAFLILCCVLGTSLHAQFRHPDKDEFSLEYFMKLAQEAEARPAVVEIDEILQPE